MSHEFIPTIVLEGIAEQAATQISTLAPGTLIFHEAMSELLGKPPKTKYYNLVRRNLSKVLMKKYGILLKNKIGKGYEIPHVGEEYQVPAKRVELGCNQIGRAKQELSFINTDKMTAIQAKKTIDQRNKTALLCAAIRNAYSLLPPKKDNIPQITVHNRFSTVSANDSS